MAPELFGMSYDKSVDMWSLGCILYFLATGKICAPAVLPPDQFDGEVSRSLFLSTYFSLTAVAGEIACNHGSYFEELFRSLCERDPEKRLTADGLFHSPLAAVRSICCCCVCQSLFYSSFILLLFYVIEGRQDTTATTGQ